MSRRVPVPARREIPPGFYQRDFPAVPLGLEHRRVVCKRCHLIMVDCEPFIRGGEFYHLAKPHQTRALACHNGGQQFSNEDPEIEPFLRKGRRRFLKRAGIRP